MLAGGPMTAAELTAVLGGRGLTLGPAPEHRLEAVLDSSSRFVELAGGRWASTEVLLDGITWTTRISPDEAAAGQIPIDEDLVLLDGGTWTSHRAWKTTARSG